jgi:hypothetical protein
MIQIKQVIDTDENFYNIFLQYCCRSKPYDFCSLNSRELRKFKIQEYYQTLVKGTHIYGAYDDDKWIGFVFISCYEELIIEFIFGDNENYTSSFLIKAFHEILILAQKTFDKPIIKSTIQRKHKKQKFINWIKRYDKVCEIIELNNKTEIFWKHERLN